MTKPLLLLATAFLYLSTDQGWAQSTRSGKTESRIDKLIADKLPSIAPGAVVLVAKDQDILYYKAIGKDNVAANTKMNREAVFRIGSLTKPFTAVAVLMLVQENKIHLEDTLQQYIPDFPVKDFPVTIRHLLTNTSGIKNYMEITNPSKEKPQYTPREGVAYFQDAPLEFEPGTQYRYSNSNFYLLGYIIEKVSGQPYQEFIQKRIFNQVGMPHSYYGHISDSRSHLAAGYSTFDGKMEAADLEEITTMYAAGGLLSNAMDLLHWHQALFSGKLINDTLLKGSVNPVFLRNGRRSGYGYGWMLSAIDSVPTIEHSGSTDGYQTDLVYIPQQRLRIITLFNCFETDKDWTSLTNDIARIAMGKPLDNHVLLTKEALQRYVGVYKYKEDWQMIFTLKGNDLYVRCPKAGLPDVRLYALKENLFYIKEAPLKFELLQLPAGGMQLTTYNNSGKDADWIRIDSTNHIK